LQHFDAVEVEPTFDHQILILSNLIYWSNGISDFTDGDIRNRL